MGSWLSLAAEVNTTLRRLDLQNNGLDTAGALAIGAALAANEKLDVDDRCSGKLGKVDLNFMRSIEVQTFSEN